MQSARTTEVYLFVRLGINVKRTWAVPKHCWVFQCCILVQRLCLADLRCCHIFVGCRGPTRMSSNRVAWSTLTKSLSQVVTSSSVFDGLSSSVLLLAATWNLQYSITFDRIFAETFGSGTVVSSPPVSTGIEKHDQGKASSVRSTAEPRGCFGSFAMQIVQ